MTDQQSALTLGDSLIKVSPVFGPIIIALALAVYWLARAYREDQKQRIQDQKDFQKTILDVVAGRTQDQQANEKAVRDLSAVVTQIGVAVAAGNVMIGDVKTMLYAQGVRPSSSTPRAPRPPENTG